MMEEIDPMTGLPIMPMQPNRGGAPNRTFTPGSTIQDLGMQPVAQMKDFSKFNSMAMKLEDLSGDGKITKKDFLIGAKVIDKEGNKL